MADEDAGFSGRDQAPGQRRVGAASGLPLDSQEADYETSEEVSDFLLLKKALLNERMAPEILQYKEDLVERVKAKLQRQEGELQAMEADKEYDLVRQVLSYERDRVRFLLKAYLRARLEKVEAYAGALLDSAALRERLSRGERQYASNFFVALGRHLKDSVLNAMPPHYQSLVKRYEAEAEKTLLDKPDTNTYVFCEILTQCGNVPDGPDNVTAELRRGDIMVARYRTVAQLVAAGQVCLL